MSRTLCKKREAMRSIFHIIKKSEIKTIAELGSYKPISIEADGFIHCSYVDQICRVANNLYNGQDGLVLIEIDRSKTNCKVVDEDLYKLNELFPHIYGPLPYTAIIAIHDFKCTEVGHFDIPGSVVA